MHRPSHRALLLRRSMPELRELIDKSRELYTKAFPGAKFREVEKVWKFPSGATLEFGYLDRDADVYRYQGQAYSWIGIDELTQYPTEFPLQYLQSRLRTTDAEIKPYIRCTANPGGVGGSWVKKRYLDPSPPNESFIGEDVKSTLEAANQFAQYSKNLTLNLGNSGTGIRLLTGYIAGSGKKCTLIGDKSLSKRPMRRISDPLNNWGAKISLREDKYPPIEIAESKLLSNFVYELEIPSAQIKSCLLFAALSSKTKIEIIENIPSRDHTERLLQECDADIFREGNKIIFLSLIHI